MSCSVLKQVPTAPANAADAYNYVQAVHLKQTSSAEASERQREKENRNQQIVQTSKDANKAQETNSTKSNGQNLKDRMAQQNSRRNGNQERQERYRNISVEPEVIPKVRIHTGRPKIPTGSDL